MKVKFEIKNPGQLLIQKETNGQYYYEIGDEITIDIAEAVSITMLKDHKQDTIWDLPMIYDRNISPIKSLYWLTGGHKEWRTLTNYKEGWSKMGHIFVDKWGDKITQIVQKSKKLGDIRKSFNKDCNFLDIYEFSLKNSLLR